MPTPLPSAPRAAIEAAPTVQAQLAARQVVITQTITSADTVFTTVVTLGRGGDAATTTTATTARTTTQIVPAATAPTGDSSGGLTQTQIGIIVGCCVGFAVLAFLAWCCLGLMRKRAKVSAQSRYDSDDLSFTTYTSAEVTEPRATAWTEYHRVRPPYPPRYRAVSPAPRWTARPRPNTTYVRTSVRR